MRAIEGEALRPPAPVHLRAERRPDGDLALSWVQAEPAAAGRG